MNKISTVNTAMNDMTHLCKQLEEFVFLHKQKREALFKTVGTYYVQFVPMGTFNFVYNLYLVLILY